MTASRADKVQAMTASADQMIAALRSGHDELAVYVERLDEAALSGPSGASGWDVARVLSHLGGGAESMLAALESALASGGPPGRGADRGVRARWECMSAVERRDGFLSADRRLVGRYESLDQATRANLRVDVGFLPTPVSVAVTTRIRLAELTYHAWDVKAWVEPTVTLAPLAVPLLFDVVGKLIGRVARPEALGGRRAALAVELTDLPGSYGLDLAETIGWTERPAQPDGVLLAPAEAWLRLVAGRLAPEHTPAGIEITGPISLDDLRRTFPGY